MSFQLQERDIQLLRGLFESRVMTRDHVADLYFGGKAEAARKRLQRLKAVGLITHRPRHPGEPATLILTRTGFELLHDRQRLGWYPRMTWAGAQRRLGVSRLTLQHELDVVGVHARMSRAIAQHKSLRVLRFSTWPVLHQFKTTHQRDAKIIKPDAYLHLEQHGDGPIRDHHFFIEVDRSTESLKVLLDKCVSYLNHYKSGGFAASQGASPERYKQVPFRVLIICKSTQRRDNLAGRLVSGKPSIRGLVWLTTMDELEADPLGAIWVTPAMYLTHAQTKNNAALALPKRLLIEPRQALTQGLES